MVQVLVNLGVVSGMLPVTGVTLPFVSYGGSSLAMMMTSLGVVINMATGGSETK
jgi:cell division protein FtsW